MPGSGKLVDETGFTLLVFGMPASGKSLLISRLTQAWLSKTGELEVAVIADNGLLQHADLAGAVSPLSSAHEIRLSSHVRRWIAASTSRDVVAESIPGQIAVLELATFEWQTVQDNLGLPIRRRSYGIYLSCTRDVSLRRQGDRALKGAFNAVLPADVMDRFLATKPPRNWLASQLDHYWEFDTSDLSVDDVLAAVPELSRYGARSVRHLYHSGGVTRATRESLEQPEIS